MSISNLSNEPIKFKIGEKEYLVKRLTLLDLYASFENDIKKGYMDDIVALAERIKDSKERMQFQKEAIKDMPRGRELSLKVQESMDGIDGGIKILYLALSKCQKIDIDEVKSLIGNVNLSAQINTVMDFIVGNDVVKEEEKLPEGAIKLDVEKKTII